MPFSPLSPNPTQELTHSVRQAIFFRWIGMGLLFIGAVINDLLTIGSLNMALISLGVFSVSNLVCMTLVELIRRWPEKRRTCWLAWLLNSIAFYDIILLGLIAYLRGGVTGALLPVYMVYIPVMTLVLKPRVSTTVLGLAFLLLNAVIWLPYLGVAPVNALIGTPEYTLARHFPYVLKTSIFYSCYLVVTAFLFRVIVLRYRKALDVERALKGQIEVKANTDELTGLHNRYYLYEILDTQLDRSLQTGEPFTIILGDLDHYKSYNDTYGHLAGDQALQELAAAIRSNIRSSDYAFRYGGDEFLVLLPGATLNQAEELAERIRQGIAAYSSEKNLAASHNHITISLGVACYPHHGKSSRSLIRVADEALLRAKQQKNCVIFAEPAYQPY